MKRISILINSLGPRAMESKSERRILSIVAATVSVLLASSTLSAGTVDVSCASGVQDYDGQWLQGSALAGSGDLIQVIYAGPDGQIDAPDHDGNPTGDDVLIGATFVGAGFPLNPDEGKFAVQLTDPLLVSGNAVFVRGWNDASVPAASRYGDSQLTSLVVEDGFGSADFPTWSTGELVLAVELTSFDATGIVGGVKLEWVTQSETDNAGFHVYRSMCEDGPYEKINEKLIPGAGNAQDRREYAYNDHNVESDTTYYYKLADVDFAGQVVFHGPASATVKPLPRKYKLEQNFPNPFNPATSIVFDLKEAGYVTLKIYNMLGQLVRVLVDEKLKPGTHTRMWDATNELGVLVPSGLYSYVLATNGLCFRKIMLHVK